VDRLVEGGRLRRLHRGVYVLGPTIPPRARELAAVLACGPGAVLSHRSAAQLWELLPYPAAAALEVTVPARDPGLKPGIALHRVKDLGQGERTRHRGIPITTPGRTLLDLAACPVSDRELEQAIAEAFTRNLTNRSRLVSLLSRHPRRRGVKRLRSQLEADRKPTRTRSRAEARLLALIRKAKLPHPEVNVRLGRWEVDFLWRDRALAVETDGYAAHSSPSAFRRDRAKDRELGDCGYRLIRIPWQDLRDEPEAVLARLAGELSRRAPGGGRLPR